ncbi:MAG: hypothetical protein HRU19_22515 [Pseudobacteriovorax sp.]|nr:hypothetical protein [Pseudobacteriovorax sp.]
MVKEVTVPQYEIDFYGTRVELRDVVVYLDDDSEEDGFSQSLPHRIPRFEMARVAVVSAAMQDELIHLETEDVTNGVLNMYKKACAKELSLELEGRRRHGVERILAELVRFEQSHSSTE